MERNNVYTWVDRWKLFQRAIEGGAGQTYFDHFVSSEGQGLWTWVLQVQTEYAFRYFLHVMQQKIADHLGVSDRVPMAEATKAWRKVGFGKTNDVEEFRSHIRELLAARHLMPEWL